MSVTMTSYLFTIILLVVFMSAAAYDDYDYSPGSNLGDTGASVWALLTKEPGWTADTPEEAVYIQRRPEPSKSLGVSIGGTKTVNANGLIKPQIEILKIIESFFILKGEIASRVNAVVTDNWGLIKALINTFVGKIGTLHAFTLKGIVVLRKILEFAATLFGHWDINVPSFDFGVSSSVDAGLW